MFSCEAPAWHMVITAGCIVYKVRCDHDIRNGTDLGFGRAEGAIEDVGPVEVFEPGVFFDFFGVAFAGAESFVGVAVEEGGDEVADIGGKVYGQLELGNLDVAEQFVAT